MFDEPPPDFDRASADELMVWVKRMQRQLLRESRAKPRKCARPSCGRARAPGFTHCCPSCEHDLGASRHTALCSDAEPFKVQPRFVSYRRA